MRNIGKNIRDLRIRRNMTQEELAEKLFVTRQTVSNYETGKSRPDIDMLTRISEVLEADVNEVLYGAAKQQDRKKDFLQFEIHLGICIILWITMYLLEDYTWNLYHNSFHSFPRALQYWVLCPFAFFCSGYTLMQLLSLFTGLRPLTGKYTKWVRWSILTVVIGSFLFLLPFFLSMVEGSIRYMIYKAQNTGGGFSYSTGVNATALHMFLLNILDKQPWTLALFGGALWLVKKQKNLSVANQKAAV